MRKMANLVPLFKSSLIKSKKSSIVKIDNFLAPKSKSSSAIIKTDKFLEPKSSATIKYTDKSTQSLESDDILKQIQKKVIKIDKLLKSSLLLKKKDAEKKRIFTERKQFEKKENELEKKKPKKIPGIKFPSLPKPKLGIFDWIKNFITQTILGFIFIRLIDHLPKLFKLLPIIFKAGDFIIDIGGKLLDGLVSFVDWGYKAYDATRGFVKNIFGEGGVKQFDNLMSTLNTLSSVIILASLASAGGGKGGVGGGRGGVGGRGGGVGIRGAKDVAGRSRYGTSATAARRYTQRFGRDAAIKKFGAEGVRSLGGRYARSGATNLVRKGLVGIAGKGGAKAILGTVRPLLKRLPIIGALIDFGLSVALGESLGRAAFRSIGAGLLGSVGAAIGSVVPVAGNIIGGAIGGIAGDAIGGALYDMFFGGKKPQKPKGQIAKAAGGGRPTTRGGRLVGGPTRRTLKKKKQKRTLSFTPREIKPGASVGGEAKIRSVFPNPEKAWWDPFGLFSGKQPKEKPEKPKEKQKNSQQFLVDSNDTLGRSNFFGPFFTLAIKSVLGQRPDQLDYKNAGKGLNAWVNTTFKSSTFEFSGGGEVDASKFFGGEDYTKVITKSVEDSVSKEVDKTIRNLSKELSLRPVGKDEMREENSGGGTGGGTGGGGGGGGDGSDDYGDDPHGTPGPVVKTTKGFNAGKGDKSRKIFLHWTAADYRTPFTNYHTTFLSDGTAIRNTTDYGIDKTEHTAGANTNSVGLSIAAMGGDGVNENNFGKFPPTSAQVSAMALEAARLAVSWGWDESTIDKNVMTHGEWERYATRTGKLPGRPQRWDLDKLRQGDKMNSGGGKLRKMIKSYFKKLKSGTTTDASGTIKVTSTGAPIAQMSLETATEMIQPRTGVDRVSSGVSVSGGNADFWTLAAVASLESGNAQGQADVAQAIYNRVASRSNFGQGSNHTIKGHILARNQFQPVRETKGSYDIWSKIVDKETAIKALSAHPRGKNAAQMIERAAANIKNPQLQKNAAEWVGGRTDFAVPSAANKYPGGIGFKTRHNHLFGWYVGPGSIAYGKTNPGPASVPSLGVMGGGSSGTEPLGKGYGSAGSKIAGELGRYIKKKLRQGPDFSQVHRHPEHPPYSLTSGHTRGSLHYEGRAVDIGAYTYEQGPILKVISEFNRMKGVKPVQLYHGKNEPRGHGDHVHVAYEKGGETLDGPHPAILGDGKGSKAGSEYVIDADTTKTIKKFAPGLLDIFNYKIYNKSSLIKYAPSIIEQLKSISGYDTYRDTSKKIKDIPAERRTPTSSELRDAQSARTSAILNLKTKEEAEKAAVQAGISRATKLMGGPEGPGKIDISSIQKDLLKANKLQTSINEKLKTISEYTDYEKPYGSGEVQIVYLPGPVEYVSVPMGSKGGSDRGRSFIDNTIPGMETLDAVG